MPLGVLMGLANGKHWQEGGENPRYFYLSLQAASLPVAGLPLGSSSHWMAFPSRSQVLLDKLSYAFHFYQVLLDT